jgi:predicted CoA-binding protein
MKTTLVIGASTNPERYSYKAIKSLQNHGHEVIAYGIKKGSVGDIKINNEWDETWNIDTVTLYVGPTNQPELYDKIISLHPMRIIFNPGTENTAFMKLLTKENIRFETACTLVLLSTRQY